MPGQKLAPAQIAAALRRESPLQTKDLEDWELVRALKATDPETYADLMDPLLEGSEMLLPARMKGPSRPQDLLPPPLPTPTRQPTTADKVITGGLRVGGALGGSLVGGAIGGGTGGVSLPVVGAVPGAVAGVSVGGGIGSGAGDRAAQWYEKQTGLRKDYSLGATLWETGIGMVNPGARGASIAARVGQQAGVGAALGGVGTIGRSVIEHGELPSVGDVAFNTVLGAGLGGSMHGVVEGIGAIRRRVPDFGDSTGSLPDGGSPPPAPPDLAPMVRAVYQQEEQRLGQALVATFGEKALAGKQGDFQTTLKAKTALRQLANLTEEQRQLSTSLQDVLATSFDPPTVDPYAPPVPPSRQLARGDFADPGILEQQDLVGYRPPTPPLLERFGGQVEQALSQPPGPGRVLGPPRLRLTPTQVAQGGPPPTQPLLLEPPRVDTRGPLRSPQFAELGGAPPSANQPRLPGITTPRPIDRTYATGPNAGPRREGELHGRPRITKRQIQVEGKTTYEYPPAALRAEDPATYPPEVRRELARMVREIEEYGPQARRRNPILDLEEDGVGGDQDLLRAIASYGGLGEDAGFRGEIAGLWEAADQYRRRGRQSRRTGRISPTQTIQSGSVGGVPGVLKRGPAGRMRRQGGLSLDYMAEALRQDPRFAYLHLEGPNDLLDALSAITTRAKRTPPPRPSATPGPSTLTRQIVQRSGAHAHATTAEIQRAVRGALLEGRGSLLSDAAAQVARDRARREAAGEVVSPLRADAGDDLIGWVDADGNRALPDQDLDEWTRAARGVSDDEIRGTLRIADEMPFDEAVQPYYDAAQTEAVRRGLIDLQQPDLVMEGPGGAGGPRITQFEGGPPPPSTDQPDLPDAGSVRTQDLPTPAVADAPFSLQRDASTAAPVQETLFGPPPKPPTKPDRMKPTGTLKGELFRFLEGEEGSVILPPPLAGDRDGLRQWLKKQAKHEGEHWHARVEHFIDAGEWDKAWQAAMSASLRSRNAAQKEATTPEARRALEQMTRGTALQDDFNMQIIASQRALKGVPGTPAPPVPDAPPSPRISQAGAARGRATIGPGGIANPGPPQRPLSTLAPALRSGRLDNTVVKMLLDLTTAEGMSTIPGNTDTYGRVFRQIGEQWLTGKNLRMAREAGIKGISPEEIAQHLVATASDLGRGLNLFRTFAARNPQMTEAAERWSMGGALNRMLGRGHSTPTYAGGRVLGSTAQKELTEIIETTRGYHQNMLARALQKRPGTTKARAVHDMTYPFMLMRWATAVRDYVSMQGRYTADSLGHAVTIPIATLMDPQTAQLAKALWKERGLFMLQKGAAVNPFTRAWKEDLQGMWDLSEASLGAAAPQDVKHFLKLVHDTQDIAAHLLGGMGGEDVQMVTADIPVLRHLTNPKVQRVVSTFRRASEMSARSIIGSATMRALVRVQGHNPDVLLRKPIQEVIAAVGGQDAWEDLLYVSTSQALEGTFSGELSRDSLPGVAVRMMNAAWPAKLAMPFPKFNMSTAPRYLWDHSFMGLVDLIRYPLDAAGWTVAEGSTMGGRLFRGVRAQQIERTMLPQLALKIGQQERRMGTAALELVATQSEWEIRNRQVRHLTTMQGNRPAAALPGIQSRLDAAIDAKNQLHRKRDRIIAERDDARQTIADHRATEKVYQAQLEDARAINAPNASQFLARQAVGAAGFLGAALLIRSQEEAQGTKWYQYPISNAITGRAAGADPVMLDFRAFAPFAQYLFVADVIHDLEKHTNWDGVRQQVGDPDGDGAGPLDWMNGMWDHYEGKYTAESLGTEFTQAFLSISRAAGTTLTLVDLATQNGVPGPQEITDAFIGSVGQFLARMTVGTTGQIKELIGMFDPEEAKARIPPKMTRENPWAPLSAPLAHVPYASRYIPETLSQVTGDPIQTNYPALRLVFGVGTSSPGFIEQERLRTGLPGRSVYINTTGNTGLDQTIARVYAKWLKQELGDRTDPTTGETLPGLLSDPEYTTLPTVARQRDRLQEELPKIKRWAMQEVEEILGAEAVQAARQGGGETARKVQRQQRQLQDLASRELGTVSVIETESTLADPDAPPAPPGGFNPALDGPPAPPF